jgi:hypothetical protein
LTNSEIRRIVEVLVLPDGLDRGNVSRIVGALLPADKVDEDTAVKIIACLGLGSERAPLQTQVQSIVGLINVGVIVEVAGDGVSVSYVAEDASSTVWGNIPFSQLRLAEVCPGNSFLKCRRYIAHLLFLLTTRSHVKTYRIQAMYVYIIYC